MLACSSRPAGAMDDDDTDSAYKIRSDCQDVATSSFPATLRRRRLTPRKWRAAFNSEGQLNIRRVLHYIERGGVAASIRAEVWEFLLGCYSPNTTAEERRAIRQSRRDQYFKLKSKCKAMDPAVGSGSVITTPRINDDGSPVENRNNPPEEPAPGTGPDSTSSGSEFDDAAVDQTTDAGVVKQDDKVVQWKLTLHQIGLDVLRTDRVLEFYEDPKNLGKLWDVLAVYAWVDAEVGYCQGMSDLCSPMVILFSDEADAFWCFKFFMLRVRENFRCTNKTMGVQNQLAFLGSAMQVIDPKLHKFIEELGGGNYIFAFRMLMVIFRREFSFADTLYLWEMFWAFEYHPDLKCEVEVDIVHVAATRSPDKRAGGMFAKRNIKYGSPKALEENKSSLPVFFVAGILEMLRNRLMKRTQGLDEVVKMLNDMTGKINPHKACNSALKFHKLYLKKLKKVQ